MTTKVWKKVLRSVFLDPKVDEMLRQVAFRRNISKGELIRTYVERGIAAEREAARAQAEAAAQPPKLLAIRKRRAAAASRTEQPAVAMAAAASD